MTYRVIITQAALDDVEQFLDYLIDDQQAPLTAERWWNKALGRVLTLKEHPHRCPYAPENSLRDYTIRAMRVDSHLFLYRVCDEEAVVEVFGFRHGAMLPREEELPE